MLRAIESLISYTGTPLDPDLSRHARRWFLIGLVIHLVTAVFSFGFHHFDEHWQILEFLGARLSLSPIEDLSWEYTHRMRSWAQPILYLVPLKLWQSLGIADPFFWATSFRLLTGLIGWISCCLLSIAAFYFFAEKLYRRWAIIFLQMIWYLPYIQARPSSESLGLSVFAIGFSLLVFGLMRRRNGHIFSPLLALGSGIVLGASFLFRFQMGFSILFLWIAASIFEKLSVRNSFLIAFGVVIAVLIELPIDRWGYGTWTITAWNYLYHNLILDKASEFPTSPWWENIVQPLSRGVPPLSLVLLCSQIIFWVKRPKHLITWATASLFIVHTIIGAKALRYLFPILIFTPLTLLELPRIFKLEAERVREWFRTKKWLRWSAKFLLGLNVILLLQVMFRPAKTAVGMYDFVYHQERPIEKIYYAGENPYQMVGLQLHFYRPKGLELEPLDLEKVSMIEKRPFWLFVDRGEKIFRLIGNSSCALRYSTYPRWLLNWNIGGWVDRSRVWALFYCD